MFNPFVRQLVRAFIAKDLKEAVNWISEREIRLGLAFCTANN